MDVQSQQADRLIDKPNFFALLIGPPEHGKSSLLADLVEQRLRAGRWALIQDTNQEFHRLCSWYGTIEQYMDALLLAAREARPITRGAAFACPNGADELVELARSLGKQWNQDKGGVREPLCLGINEASAFEESGSTFLGKLQNIVLNQRRHLGLELIYCLQRPTMLPQPVYDVATDVFLFYQPNAERIRFLEKALGFDAGELAVLRELEPHRYLHWKPRRAGGGGLV